jgi:regulator of protease activity HflC (stomatin/prohibitin superfamily)
MKDLLITRMEVNTGSNLNYIDILKNRETIEKELTTINGYIMLLISLLLFFGGIGMIVAFGIIGFYPGYAIAFPSFICGIFFFTGFFNLQPNEVAVVTMCGSYKGTVEDSGYHWIFPFNTRMVVSLRSRNINIEKLKVNDKSGNPIEIGAVIVWRIKHAAKSVFDVVDAAHFASLNSESALRHIALSYHYDKSGDNEVSLRTGSAIIMQELIKELQERLEKAGIEVEEARITHLAYAPEIASVMLKRQQAEAIIAAREKIVQGAVSIVGHALNALKENKIVDMNNEEKSKLVSNMLVILCSDSQVTPVLNTGV